MASAWPAQGIHKMQVFNWVVHIYDENPKNCSLGMNNHNSKDKYKPIKPAVDCFTFKSQLC